MAMTRPVWVSRRRIMTTKSVIVKKRRREMVRVGRRGAMLTVVGTGERRVSVGGGAPTGTKIASQIVWVSGRMMRGN